MPSDAFQRFQSSMVIDYEKWHDGVGYDIEALDELSPAERIKVEHMLAPRAEKDWRDLEALDRLGTPGALQAIWRARESSDADIRMHALQYGPTPTPAEWDKAIVYSLRQVKPFAGLVITMESAIEHPSPRVVAALWQHVKVPGSEITFHAAQALLCIAGKLDGQYDDAQRPLQLRLQGPASADRDLALTELAVLCNGSAASGANTVE